MLAHSDKYDLSEYPHDHPCYNPANAKMLGLFKDESAGRPVTEVVAICSKMYSIKRGLLPGDVAGDRGVPRVEVKKAKGVSSVVVNKDLTHELYKNCLLKGEEYRHTQLAIRSKGHKIGLYEIDKTSLSPIDTKRFILEDGIHTLAYGHWRIPK